jgi:hypothetical protein
VFVLRYWFSMMRLLDKGDVLRDGIVMFVSVLDDDFGVSEVKD